MLPPDERAYAGELEFGFGCVLCVCRGPDRIDSYGSSFGVVRAPGRRGDVLCANGLKVLVLEAGPNRFIGLDSLTEGMPTSTYSNDDLKLGDRGFIDPHDLVDPRTFRADTTTDRSVVGDVNGLPKTVGGGTIHADMKTPRFAPTDLQLGTLLGSIDGAAFADSQPYDGRPACVDCGFCGDFGCVINAKGSAAVTSLRKALLTGNYVRRRSLCARGEPHRRCAAAPPVGPRRARCRQLERARRASPHVPLPDARHRGSSPNGSTVTAVAPSPPG